MKILLASRNRDKLKEVRGKVAGLSLDVLTPDDFPDLPEVEEDGATLEANAEKKALTLHRLTGLPTLADDTGLEVYALDGAPGVYSSRYAGPGATYADNCRKLLQAMEGVPEKRRGAHFRTVLAWIVDGRVRLFDGRVEGRITTASLGSNGFGYDPVFFVPELGKTLAELSLEEKNRISHRGRALDAWVEYLRGAPSVG
ncbi:MAG: RdgB/HAM1 family non-canonical purine NTP pyrophosphatase [Candidatus Zixiibacteriota bacterium]|nr:MAG: RdgB/HAM1 family non-canonical purine NTP pyrophosphatase [candidate division Zixibacteria bacterium]